MKIIILKAVIECDHDLLPSPPQRLPSQPSFQLIEGHHVEIALRQKVHLGLKGSDRNIAIGNLPLGRKVGDLVIHQDPDLLPAPEEIDDKIKRVVEADHPFDPPLQFSFKKRPHSMSSS